MKRRLTACASQRSARKSGFVSIEVILVLPMLMVLLLGLFEFSMLFTARGQVVEAAHAAARMATLHGVDDLIIEDQARRSLSAPLATSAKVETRHGVFSGDEVLVRVRVPMAAATPDLLWPIGYSVRNRELVAEARMLKE